MGRQWSAPGGLLWRVVRRYSTWRFGKVLAPAAVMAHQPQVLRAYLNHERAATRWRHLEAGIKHLGVMMAATTVGCSWCMDFSWWASEERGVPLEKAQAVPAWREASCFNELERLVLEYAEAMSATPVSIDDALTGRLLEHLSEAQLVELTAVVALENLRSRTSRAFGLVSQGFSDGYRIGPPGASRTA